MYTSFLTGDTLTNKAWAKSLYAAGRDNADVLSLIGTPGTKSAGILLREELGKGAGDRVTCGLRTYLQGDGFTEHETMEGQGENLTNYPDTLDVNQLSHVASAYSEDTIDAQRVPFNLREECKL